jgi:hypothetical protein
MAVPPLGAFFGSSSGSWALFLEGGHMGSFMGRRWIGTWLEGKATAWEGCDYVSITQDISSSLQTYATMLYVCV